MSIWQVWEKFEEIHDAIFNTEKETISRYWLRVCCIKSENEKRKQVEETVGIIELQAKWVQAFGGDSIERARNILKRMMLFIIFGCRVAETDSLFDNGNLTDFFEEYPANEDRLKAFNICFGEFADCQKIKSRMSKILR